MVAKTRPIWFSGPIAQKRFGGCEEGVEAFADDFPKRIDLRKVGELPVGAQIQFFHFMRRNEVWLESIYQENRLWTQNAPAIVRTACRRVADDLRAWLSATEGLGRWRADTVETLRRQAHISAGDWLVPAASMSWPRASWPGTPARMSVFGLCGWLIEADLAFACRFYEALLQATHIRRFRQAREDTSLVGSDELNTFLDGARWSRGVIVSRYQFRGTVTGQLSFPSVQTIGRLPEAPYGDQL